MQGDMKTRASKAKNWTKTHPFIAVVASLAIGFTGGAGYAANSSSTQPTSARSEASPVDDAAAQLAELEAENTALSNEIASLTDHESDLNEQILRLNAKRPLPSLVGGSDDEASDLEDDFGWTLKVHFDYSTEKPGTVLSQSPNAGTVMRYGAPFTIVVAKQIPKVPDLVGLTRGRALRDAKQLGYEISVVEQISSRRPGTVIAMTPGVGTRLVPGELITITVAKKAPPPPPVAQETSGCTPGYSPCLPPASDYDCLGGSGDGPQYTGYVTVTGSDPYGLDSDGDGAGCES